MRTSANEDATSAAISVLTNMIGALTMARLVDDPALSDRILQVTRERLTQAMNVVTQEITEDDVELESG